MDSYWLTSQYIPVYYNNNTLLHKVHGLLLTYRSRIPVYYNNNGLVYEVHGPLLTYKSHTHVYYNNNTLLHKVHGPLLTYQKSINPLYWIMERNKYLISWV
jgi:hypothetical protein